MKTQDLKKQYKHFYQPSAKKIECIQVPNLQFAMIDGAIDPVLLPYIAGSAVLAVVGFVTACSVFDRAEYLFAEYA